MAVSKICRSFMNFVSILTQLVLSNQPVNSPERTWHKERCLLLPDLGGSWIKRKTREEQKVRLMVYLSQP